MLSHACGYKLSYCIFDIDDCWQSTIQAQCEKEVDVPRVKR